MSGRTLFRGGLKARGTFCPHRLRGCFSPRCRSAPTCTSVCLQRQSAQRCSLRTLPFQGLANGSRACGGGFHPCARFSLGDIPFRLNPCSSRRLAFARRGQIHPGAASLGKPDRDGLFRGAHPMFSLADVVHLFADRFPRLGSKHLSLREHLSLPCPTFPFPALNPPVKWRLSALYRIRRASVEWGGVPCWGNESSPDQTIPAV